MKKTALTRTTSLNRVSPKQEDENKLRLWMRYTLWREQEGKCKKCGRVLSWNQTELSHKKRLSQGGKTTRENCEVLCANWLSDCHPKEHGLRNFYNEQPQWGK